MTTLRTILAELGLKKAVPHFGSASTGGWVSRPRFDPVEGACYELAFTPIPMREDSEPVIKRVRIDGPSAEDWFDLDTRRPLDRSLYAFAVKAYRRLDEAGHGETFH